MAIAPTRTDSTLVRRLQQRDRGAWEELYAEYQPRLRAFGYRLTGSAHDADDLAQETFVRALPALDRLDPDTVDLSAYLFATTKNLFLKQVERSKRAEPTAEVPEPDLPTAIEDDPERSALLHHQQEEVRIANGRLDPRQRLVLALCELEDRSYAEIGELVGLNENAVAQLVFRARERLRTELRLVQVDPASLPEECRTFLPLLAQHLDGKLRGPKLGPTLAHLESCERCQAALADMREAKRRYRALLLPPLGIPAEDARAAIDEELDRAGYWDGPSRDRVLLRLRGKAGIAVLAGMAAMLLGGGLGAATLLTRTAEPTVAEAAPSTEPDTTPDETTAPETTEPVTTAAAKQKPKQPANPAPIAPEPTETAETTPPTSPVVAPTTAPEPTVSPPTTEPPPPPPPPPPPTPPPPPPKDTVAPRVSFTASPAAATAEPSATFAFSANEAKVTFGCRLDGGGWLQCSSPHAVQGLALGAHTLAVRATDSAGNVGAPATRQWTVTPPPDTTPPTVSFTQTPAASTTAKSATFAFAANEPNATFACSYDNGPFAACQSPYTVNDIGVDDHTFAVRATDAAGNTGSPATFAWNVVEALPDLVVVLTDTTVTVRNVGEAAAGASIVTVSNIGTFTIQGLAPGQSATRTFSCRRGTITATADATRLVTESNEGNNVATNVASCI